MTIETIKAAVAILEAQDEVVSLEYPGIINIERHGWVYVFGDANEEFGASVYTNWVAFEKGETTDAIVTPLSSDHTDPAAVASAITDAVRRHQDGQEPRYYVMNETDGLLAHPEPMSQAGCDTFMAEFRQRFAAQGYYASAAGRIPVSELRLKAIPAGEL